MLDAAALFPTSILAALGIGIALASAPGPVQAVILAEAARGGPGRALRVVAGAAVTFGTLLVALALGLSIVALGGLALQVLQVLGGALLVWLAYDGLRAAGRRASTAERRGLPVMARGSLAVLLNPGAWLFLGAVAAPLVGAAAREGGTGASILTALALEAGTATGDLALALVAGIGLRRAGSRMVTWVQRGLALLLGCLGLWLIASGVLG